MPMIGKSMNCSTKFINVVSGFNLSSSIRMEYSMNKMVSIACLFAAAALLAAAPKEHEPSSRDRGSAVAGSGSTNPNVKVRPPPGAARADANGMARGSGRSRTGRSAESRIIYFDFDKSDIKPEFAAIVSANAST